MPTSPLPKCTTGAKPAAGPRTQPSLDVTVAILKYFPHGGLQRIALGVAKALRDRGHRVELLTAKWDGPLPSSETGAEPAPEPAPQQTPLANSRGAPSSDLDGDLGGGPCGMLNVREIHARGRTNHARARRFGAALQERRMGSTQGVILGFDRLPGLDLYFAGDPCYAGRLRRERPAIARWTSRARTFLALERAVFARTSSTRVLLMNASERDVIQAEYGTPSDRFAVLPPGFSRPPYPADANEIRRRVRMSLGLKGEHCLLALGSDFHRKGFDRAVRALARADEQRPSLHLLIAGNDSPRRIQALASELGVGASVHCLGPRDDVPELLLAADLLVHPARSEPAGMVILEALGMGLPVITTTATGYAVHVSNSGAGAVLDEPFDQAAFSTALDQCLRDNSGKLRDNALCYSTGLDPLAMERAVVAEVEAAGSSL